MGKSRSIMFSCRYKFTLEDNQKGAKFTLKQNKALKTLKIVAIVCLAIGFVCSIIGDIINAYNGDFSAIDIFFDVVLLAILILMIFLPEIQNSANKKIFMQSLADKDMMNVDIDEKTCSVSFYKAGEMTSMQKLDLTLLTSAGEDDFDIILVFKKNMFVVIKKSLFEGELDLFRKLITSYTKEEIKKI